MISNQDRSGYIGASDTKYVVSRWNTKTFDKWWLKKLGLDTSSFSNKYTLAGNNFEHKIVDSLGIEGIIKDKQIIKGRIRVNLDANTDECIYEIKTYVYENGFDIKKHQDYINQVLVQMYISKIHKANIIAYGLLDSDYNNYFNDIDKERLSIYPITYDEDKLKKIIPRLNYLEQCLIKGTFPNENEIKEGIE